MKHRRVWLALAIAAAFAPLAHALDLEQACRSALEHAPQAAIAQASRDAGAARSQQARALWRPNLAFEGGVSYASSDTSVRGAQFSAPGFGQSSGVGFDTSINSGIATRYAVELRQPIYSRERTAMSQSMQISAEAAEIEWTQARQALILRTVDAYFAAALAADRLRLLERQQKAVDEAATQAEDRFRIGDRPVTDVHEAGARAAALQAERMAAQTQLDLDLSALSELTGLPADDAPLQLLGESVDSGIDHLGSLREWQLRAERQNPGLKLAESQIAAEQARALAASAAFSPTLDVVAQYGRERLSGSGDFGRASTTGRNNAVGIQLSVPLYTGGMRKAQSAERLALVERARAERDLARQNVDQQTRAAWLDLAVGRSRTAALAAALQASLARLDATRVGLQAGDRTTLDLLNAQNDAAAAELALQDARVHLFTRRLELAALVGELDDNALQQVNTELHGHQP